MADPSSIAASSVGKGQSSVLCKPVWSEGVLVSQHHFQQQDRYHEQLLAERLRAALRYDWGITELEVDGSLLTNQQFRLRRFAGIWPDGTVLRCGASTLLPSPPARSFEALFPPEQQVLPVYLGLAADLESGLLASTADARECRRYTPAVRAVNDVNDGQSALELEWARPDLRVFFGAEARQGYDALCIAELVRDARGAVILRDTFVPPALCLSVSPFLVEGLNRVLTKAASRQRDLMEQRPRRKRGELAHHPSEARRFLLLHTLSGALPGLKHLLEVGKAHPEEAYLALAALASELACFAEDAPPPLPRFDHALMGDVFEALFARVLALLAVEIEPAYQEVLLERRSDGMHLGRLPAASNLDFYVGVKADMPEELLRERLPGVLKVADWGHIYDLVKQSRPGLRVEPEWSPSAVLPLRPGTFFFKVQCEGAVWQGIEKSRTLALFLPPRADWERAEIALYGVDRSERA